MKKIIMLSLAMFSFLFMANAQTGECKIDNVPGAYIFATCKTQYANHYSDAAGHNVQVSITAYGVGEEAEGAVTCVVIYTDNKGNTKKTRPFAITYKNRKGKSEWIWLPDTELGSGRVEDIKIENSWCSAR